MKKILFLTIVLFITSNSFSQKGNFGVFGGVNYPFLTEGNFNKIFGGNGVLSFHVGALYNIGLSEKISFRPKLSYLQQRGEREEGDSSNHIGHSSFGLDYLNASLDFKFFDKVYLLLGPQVGYLLKQKNEDMFFPIVGSDVDFGVNLGVGFTIIDKMFLEVSVYRGFTTLFEYKEPYSSKFGNIQNANAKFTLGYNF